jgi:hypothetical protein
LRAAQRCTPSLPLNLSASVQVARGILTLRFEKDVTGSDATDVDPSAIRHLK